MQLSRHSSSDMQIESELVPRSTSAALHSTSSTSPQVQTVTMMVCPIVSASQGMELGSHSPLQVTDQTPASVSFTVVSQVPMPAYATVGMHNSTATSSASILIFFLLH